MLDHKVQSKIGQMHLKKRKKPVVKKISSSVTGEIDLSRQLESHLTAEPTVKVVLPPSADLAKTAASPDGTSRIK